MCKELMTIVAKFLHDTVKDCDQHVISADHFGWQTLKCGLECIDVKHVGIYEGYTRLYGV